MISAVTIAELEAQTRLMRKRRCRRSIAGIRLVTSAVFPGCISVHTGRPSPSSSTARII